MSQLTTDAQLDQLAVNTIRFLAADGVEKAKSGHPGLPMGAADYAYVLWAKYLKFNPKDPKWPNRDRFVLSGGHGSMLLYSLLHLAGIRHADGATQAVQAVGKRRARTSGIRDRKRNRNHDRTAWVRASRMALGWQWPQSEWRRCSIVPATISSTTRVYVIAGDGDMMEGLSHEACSLAGHLGLDNLVLFYDDNHICIEGDTALAYSDNVAKRFEAYNWNVQSIDGHDRAAITEAIAKAKAQTGQPNIIICRTCIACGAPNKAGTAAAHGEPLGEDEIKAAKMIAHWPVETPFYVPDEVRDLFSARVNDLKNDYDAWQSAFKKYGTEFPELLELWDKMMSKEVPADLEDRLLSSLDCAKPEASRNSSGQVIQELAKHVPALWGGSADLAPSNKTAVKGGGDFSKTDPLGRNIHFGVREHGMGSALNGMALYGGVIPYGGTFFVFSDYTRPTLRLASLMKQQVIYVFTHDSIFVGEDGPTHEPIEHLASLRTIPGLTVIRPADTAETVAAWAAALENKNGPTALVLSRQNLCSVNADPKMAKGLHRGGYVVRDADEIDVLLIATGSEVNASIDAAGILAEKGIKARVVSMPSTQLFEAQDKAYRDSVIPPNIKNRVVVEAASPFGWCRYAGDDGIIIGMDHFGASAPYKVLAEKFGFTAQSIAARTLEYLK